MEHEFTLNEELQFLADDKKELEQRLRNLAEFYGEGLEWEFIEDEEEELLFSIQERKKTIKKLLQ